jgi:hypothetical protein
MTNTLLLYGLIALIIAVAAFLYPVTTGLVGILGARTYRPYRLYHTIVQRSSQCQGP